MIPANVKIHEPGIYRIINKLTWQAYYGKAVDLASRYSFDGDGYLRLDGGGHHNRHLVSAWLKYGRENFVFEVLQISDIPNLQALEQHYLDHAVRWGFDYNVLRRSENTIGFTHSDEAREKIRLARVGTKRSDETRARITESKRGQKQSEATLAKRRGRKSTDEARANMSRSRRRNIDGQIFYRTFE